MNENQSEGRAETLVSEGNDELDLSNRSMTDDSIKVKSKTA